ncbi:hypothetical protein PIROE2DRAFT_19273 [Piromyces sp. E2]|nr:hypothetical protein PIROE2DRAFT_19273 [Piromyces sp. E2]|eukprot:OUM56216.1 hypothetical protein PIROE2DRAFT_19273 [Piromyces sp. E2]
MEEILKIEKILKYECSYNHFEKEYAVSISLAKHKFRDEIRKNSIPFDVKPRNDTKDGTTTKDEFLNVEIYLLKILIIYLILNIIELEEMWKNSKTEGNYQVLKKDIGDNLKAIDNKNKNIIKSLHNENDKYCIENDIVYEMYNNRKLNSQRLHILYQIEKINAS